MKVENKWGIDARWVEVRDSNCSWKKRILAAEFPGNKYPYKVVTSVTENDFLSGNPWNDTYYEQMRELPQSGPYKTPFSSEVKKKLRDSWLISKITKHQLKPTDISCSAVFFSNKTSANALDLYEEYTFLDGSPCGEEQ